MTTETLNNYPSLYVAESSIVAAAQWVAGQTLQLTSSHVMIGRALHCDLVLPDSAISRQHVQLTMRGERYYLVDQESTNGTFVNGQRLTPHTPQLLKDGDMIELGDVIRLRFGDPGVTIPKAAARSAIPTGLWLNRQERTVYFQRTPLDKPLPPTEFHLLALLFDHAGRVVPRELIANTLWPDAHGMVTEAMIDNTVARLRRYLTPLAPAHEFVQTVRGVGYRLQQSVKE